MQDFLSYTLTGINTLKKIPDLNINISKFSKCIKIFIISPQLVGDLV